jgi:putative transposase
MARPLRLEYPGAVYHAIARGNNRARIIHDATDVRAFLTSLEATCQRFAWRIFAWCLMPNHYHLVMETMRPTLSRGMQRLNGTYAQYFNGRHGRVGHVFQARFKSFVVDRERYLATLLRYVELNPCRAGLVKSPVEWPWSSVHVSLGARPMPEWSAAQEIWRRFASKRKEAISAYADFLSEGLRSPPQTPPIVGGIFIGTAAFAHTARQCAAGRETLSLEVPREQRVTQPSLKRLAAVHSNPDDFARAAYYAGYSLKEIAARLGVHYSTVSRIAHRVRPRMRPSLTLLRRPTVAAPHLIA